MTDLPDKATLILCIGSLMAACICIVLPRHADAAVIINEIAWMGTAVSQNDEWIELYNDSSDPVDITGWTLSDGVSLTLSLSGTVAAGGYALLERTDDDTVSGVSAHLIYTGALANDGRTLTLRRGDSSVEDQVAGGMDWSAVGGNNQTKETAQLTTAGWGTAPATPGALNTSTSDTGDGDTLNENKKVNNSDNNVRISLTPPARVATLAIGADRTVHAGTKIVFNADASGITSKLKPSLMYEWSFGDGSASVGREVSHTYEFPGVYLVIARAAYATFEAEARITVTVLPVDLTLARGHKGEILIHNDSPREMDISGYVIGDGDRSFTFPPRTIVLPKGTITIGPRRLNLAAFSPQVVVRTDQGSALLFGAPLMALAEGETRLSTSSAVESVIPAIETEDRDTVIHQVPDATLEVGLMEPIELVRDTADAQPKVSPSVTYMGLLVVIMLGLATVYLRG